jgi:hypothetical protein
MPRLRGPITPRLIEPGTDRVARNHEQRLRELQSIPIVGGKLVKGVELPDSVLVTISHGLGRVATVFVSPPYKTFGTTGRISQTRDENPDETLYVTLKAVGWSGTVRVDVWVF